MKSLTIKTNKIGYSLVFAITISLTQISHAMLPQSDNIFVAIKNDDLVSVKNILDKEKLSDKNLKIITSESNEQDCKICGSSKNANYLNLVIGETPISWACVNGNLKIVQFLIEEMLKIDPNFDFNAPIVVGNHEGDTPLILACNHGHLPIIKYLVNKQANINTPIRNGYCYGQKPILIACALGYLPIVKYLTENGADFKSVCTIIDTKKMYLNEETKILNKKEMLEYKKEITPLQVAQYNNHHDVVEYLKKIIQNENLSLENNQPEENSQKNSLLEDLSNNSGLCLDLPIVTINNSNNNSNSCDYLSENNNQAKSNKTFETKKTGIKRNFVNTFSSENIQESQSKKRKFDN
jgi:ankyrin repeat protein